MSLVWAINSKYSDYERGALAWVGVFDRFFTVVSLVLNLQEHKDAVCVLKEKWEQPHVAAQAVRLNNAVTLYLQK